MAVQTTSTTTTTTSEKTGSKLVVGTSTSTQQVGTYVTDVNIQPYIANRVVSFYAFNMRPNQRVHIFFDSVLVDQYCAPGTKYPAGNYVTNITNTADYRVIEKDKDWGTAIYSDQFGQVAGQFNIPAGKFKTGDRVLEIADVDNIAQGNDALTTKATATFTASNISVTKQSLTLTTVNPELSWLPLEDTVTTTSSSITNINIVPDIGTVTGSWYEPIAQGLTINTPSGEAGVFVTSLDIYFKQKSQILQNGVTVYLCETDNGYPDGKKVIPFSTVHLPYSSINVGTDNKNQVPTNFKFESPVFLNNGVEYSFVVKPDAGDPDYWVYSANIGDVDHVTNAQVFSQPVVGTAFYGATDTQWTSLPTEYIKFELYRAKFGNATGNVYFVNSNTDYLNIYNLGYVNSTAGILSGDYVFQSTNSYQNATGGSVNTSINGILNYYDDVKQLIYVANTTGNFQSNTYMQIHRFPNTTAATVPGPNTTTLIAYANTGKLKDIVMDAVVPQFATIAPAGTAISVNVKGISNTYTADSKYYPVNVGTETEFFDKERVIASHSTEVVQSNVDSLKFQFNMSTDSEFISPIIDTVRTQQLVLANDIDACNTFIYEEFFNSGASRSKYISKIITLAEGQDAEDLQVILTAFKPAGTDIQVWVKFLNSQDSDPISAKTWTPLINEGSFVNSDPSNPDDMREYVYTIPKYYGMIPSNGTITATSSCTTITGVSTLFGTEVKTGWYINMLPNTTFNETTRRVVSISSNVSLTLDSPFNATAGYSGQPYYIVVPPTTPWLSANTTTTLSGTVNTYTTNNSIVGSSTLFTTELARGSVIQVNGDQQVVVSISNNTLLSVGTPWSSNNSANLAYSFSPVGLTYLNPTFSRYSTYKRFQIKIILKANSSALIPLVSDVRALAMQI